MNDIKMMKKRQIAIAVAIGLIMANCPTNPVYAQANPLSNQLTVDRSIGQEVGSVTLSDGGKIRAIFVGNGEIRLQEYDAVSNAWIDKNTLTDVAIKDMVAVNDGYMVTYVDYGMNDGFVFEQTYDRQSNAVGDAKMIGLEIMNADGDVLSLDFIVDTNRNSTAIKTQLGEFTVEEFIPTMCSYLGSKQIVLWGLDSKGETSILVVTENGKVLNGAVIKDSNYISSEYTEVRSLGISEIEDNKIIISGYAVKGTEPNKKDGFLIQFDSNGNKEFDVRIIPSSYSAVNDASINKIVKFQSGRTMIEGLNLGRMYISSLDYKDTRKVKEVLELENGQKYKVVEASNVSRAGGTITKSYAVKSVNDMLEYDIATYNDIKDIKLVPGNDNQLIIAVKNINDNTEVAIIDITDDAKIEENGDITSNVSSRVELKDANGPIANIDISKMYINSDGKIIVTEIGSDTEIEVTVSEINSGTQIETKPQGPIVDDEDTDDKDESEDDKVDVPVITPPIEVPPTVTPPAEKPPVVETPPTVIPPTVTPPAEKPPVVIPPVIETPPVVVPPTQSNPSTPAEPTAPEDSVTTVEGINAEDGKVEIKTDSLTQNTKVTNNKMTTVFTLSKEQAQYINSIDQEEVSLVITPDEKELKETLEKNPSIDTYQITVNAKDTLNIENVAYTVKANVVSALKDAGVTVSINVVGESSYLLLIKPEELAKINKDLKLSLSVTNSNGVEIDYKRTMGRGIKMTLRVDVSDMIKDKSSKVYVYRVNETTGKYEEIPNFEKRVSANGKISVIANPGEKYVVKTAKLTKDVVKLVDTASVIVPKTIKAGNKKNVKVYLPDELSLVKKFDGTSDPYGKEEIKVMYSVDNKSIATINSKGVITAKKAGTVKVSITLLLENKDKKVITKTIQIK